MLTEQERKNRENWLTGLRELVAWYDAHPDARAADAGTLNIWARSKEEFMALRRMAGVKDKIDGDSWLTFRKTFSGGLTLDINVAKAFTCRQVKVGEKVIPARPEEIIPAQPERTVEVFEWRCDEPLLQSDQSLENQALAAAGVNGRIAT
jgi:hypothetical protein